MWGSSRAVGAMRLPLLTRHGAPAFIRSGPSPAVPRQSLSLNYPSISSASSSIQFGPRTYSTSLHQHPRPFFKLSTGRGIHSQLTSKFNHRLQSAKMSSQAAHPALMIPGPIEFDDAVLQSMAHYRYVISLSILSPIDNGNAVTGLKSKSVL